MFSFALTKKKEKKEGREREREGRKGGQKKKFGSYAKETT